MAEVPPLAQRENLKPLPDMEKKIVFPTVLPLPTSLHLSDETWETSAFLPEAQNVLQPAEGKQPPLRADDPPSLSHGRQTLQPSGKDRTQKKIFADHPTAGNLVTISSFNPHDNLRCGYYYSHLQMRKLRLKALSGLASGYCCRLGSQEADSETSSVCRMYTRDGSRTGQREKLSWPSDDVPRFTDGARPRCTSQHPPHPGHLAHEGESWNRVPHPFPCHHIYLHALITWGLRGSRKRTHIPSLIGFCILSNAFWCNGN